MDEKLLAGQRLILGFDGISLNNELKHIIKDLCACGIILFKRNIESPEQVKDLCRSCQSYAKEAGSPPLIICTDQEGGVVARFKKPFTEFKGNPSIRTHEDAARFARTTAEELSGVGINMNLAPVLDWCPPEIDSIMKDRMFPGGPDEISTLGTTVINTLQTSGMMAVAKHFPGIGRTTLDSHFQLPVLDIDLSILEKTDMVPFIRAIENDVAGIMLSHIHYPRIDETWQASLSPVIAGKLLREKLGFQGLVFTDDLDMKAIGHDIQTCIHQILLSQIDISLICHSGPNIDKAWQQIRKLHKEDEPLRVSGEKALERILKYKQTYLIDPVS